MGLCPVVGARFEHFQTICLVSTVQANSGVMVLGLISWHCVCLLIPINHGLNIATDPVHPFMATIYPLSNHHFQHHKTPQDKVCL